jgi:hypothetical protein
MIALLRQLIRENIEKRKLYVLVGPPGVGKSWWIRQNVDDPYIISYDNAVSAVAKANKLKYDDIAGPKAGSFRKDIAELEKQQVTNAAASGKDIIVDKTNMTVKSRKRAMKAIEGSESDFEKVAVFFDFRGLEPLILKSVERRAMEEGDKNIDPGVVIGMMNRFEMPSESEGFNDIIIVDPTGTLHRH